MIASDYFDEALKFTLYHEGAWSYDQYGGETFCGIAERKHPETFATIREIAQSIEVPKSLDDLAVEVYFFLLHKKKKLPDPNIKKVAHYVVSFYSKIWHSLPYVLDGTLLVKIVMFDATFNMGLRRASKILQETINELGGRLIVDGIVGPKTRHAFLKTYGIYKDDFCFVYNGVRCANYARLKGFSEFGAGWINRVKDLNVLIADIKKKNSI